MRISTPESDSESMCSPSINVQFPSTTLSLIAILQVALPSGWNRGVSVWLQGPEHYALTVVGAVTEELFLAQVVLPLAGMQE